VLLDHWGPDVVDAVRSLREQAHRVVAVVAESVSLTPDQEWALLGLGALDVVQALPCDEAAGAALDRLERYQEVDRLVDLPVVREHAIGASALWRDVLRDAVCAARYSQAPLLLEGESGVGKELVARVVHTLDPRPDKRDLIVVDCTTVAPELGGSEFFGHERGAFTGAVADRQGAFGLADGGTLFLDEVGELDERLQAQLLRVIQEQTYKRVGGNRWYQIRFRLIAATNRDLETERLAGRFRADLFYRLASLRLRVPPLRERRDDILTLARSFAADACGANAFDSALEAHLVSRDYPGNVRELKQLVQRMAVRHAGGATITVGALPPDERPTSPTPVAAESLLESAVRQAVLSGATLDDIGRRAKDLATQTALDVEGGSTHRAARRLGVTDRALQLRRRVERPPSSR
jgi:transcriptional regulator with GAF, ATPase, and Fis domain